jgi:hypothetical protein
MARTSQSVFAKLSIAVANIGCEGLSITHSCIYYTCITFFLVFYLTYFMVLYILYLRNL